MKIDQTVQHIADAETITFSEMRHVMKMQAAPEGNMLDLLKVYGMMV